ncbi:hypothetical protein O997_03775 [Anaplasma phagocytophilum str. MRK]|nr:hypothetical protein O997_03775 [Anaplasma phagocytophilum str. MRK]
MFLENHIYCSKWKNVLLLGEGEYVGCSMARVAYVASKPYAITYACQICCRRGIGFRILGSF